MGESGGGCELRVEYGRARRLRFPGERTSVECEEAANGIEEVLELFLGAIFFACRRPRRAGS